MKMENGKTNPLGPASAIKDFRDLETWKFARRLRLEIYRVCRNLPKDETHALASQMKRAAVSVTANIAEGYGRYSFQEIRQSRAFAYELRDHCTTVLDVGYLNKEVYEELDGLAMSVIKRLNGYINATQGRKADSKSKGSVAS
jgi:four helix bundle protein